MADGSTSTDVAIPVSIYTDHHDDDTDQESQAIERIRIDTGHDYDLPGWQSIPDYLLEDILDRVIIRVKFRAAQTCRSWYRVFVSSRSWHTFIYRDLIFTRLRHTFQGMQYTIDHYRLRFLISNATREWRSLVFKTATSEANTNRLFNLYEFMRVLTNFTEYYENRNDRPLEGLRAFEFNWNLRFHCSEEAKAKPVIYGTGGQLLRGLSHLLSHLHGLQSLALRQLLLDSKEAEDFMSDLLNFFGAKLKELSVRNLTKHPHALIHFGLFLNLRKLVVSPQHLNDDSVFLISSNESMRHVIIVQDENTRLGPAVSQNAWMQFRRDAPHIRVHLQCVGLCKDEMLWQPMAPVASITYTNPAAKLTHEGAAFIADNYSDTLESYVQKGVQRRFRSKSFHDRVDTALIYVIRSCKHLSLVAIRERMSSATLLLTAHLTSFKEEFRLLVRKNAILKRSDWPHNRNEWSDEFYQWLKSSARDFEKMEAEVGNLYGNPWWHSLSDDQYKHSFRKE